MHTDPRTVRPEPVTSPEAATLLRAYVEEMVSRYWGRAATPAEVDAEIAADPSDDLGSPTGTFLLMRDGARPIGCVGLRLRSSRIVELKRMFVVCSARGRGAGRRLLATAEDVGRDWCAETIRLDTREDLVEARRLYVACGFSEVPAFNDGVHAERWYAKPL